MRVFTGLALAAMALGGVRPAPAQTEDAPPVLRRRDPSVPGVQHSKSSSKNGDASREVDATGVIQQIDSRSITIDATDRRVITCNLVNSTELLGPGGKITVKDLSPGMRVRIAAFPTSDGEQLDASSIEIANAPEKPDENTATIEKAPDEEGRPILRYGKPPKQKSDESDDDEVTRSAPATEDVPSTPRESPAVALLERAREASLAFTRNLPNFVCRQVTTRYTRESSATGWHANDVVTTTVTFVDGKEDYSDIKVGNHVEHKGMMDIKGQRSTGEFGSVLEDLMSPREQAEFEFVKDTQFRRERANMYDFKVKRENSHWQARMEGQTIVPGYRGRIWIARDNARVLRIEMKADDIPVAFPNDVLEQTVDYDFVTIGGRKVLLPIESENLGCERGSPFCSKNVIEFRDYQEFRGNATITFGK